MADCCLELVFFFGYGSRTCLELDEDPVILRILWHDFVDFT